MEESDAVSLLCKLLYYFIFYVSVGSQYISSF